jgi:hypothetical protein
MRINRGTLAAVGVAGLIAFTGSAFTATSTIDKSDMNVGSVAQSVAGVTVTNVDYAYVPATDTTTAVSATIAQLIDTTAGTVQISVNGKANESCAAAVHVDTTEPADGTNDVSTVSCDIADTVDVTSVRFVVEG